MLEVRIRACHVHGRFIAKDNKRPSFTLREALENPRRDTERVVLPPASYLHEREKIEQRWPAAVKFIKERKLNEFFGPASADIGIVVQGGFYNSVMRALQQLGLADVYGETAVPIYVLNVTYPLIDDEVAAFAANKKAILMVEEGQPEFIEQALNTILRRRDIQTKICGKDVLPMAGEYTPAVVTKGIKAFLELHANNLLGNAPPTPDASSVLGDPKIKALGKAVPPRPPGFCVGCPERPIFAAMKLVQQELGQHHVAGDIGCHLFASLPPFNIGATTMGYGLGPASSSAFNVKADKRPISIIGDGGFWHNGLSSSVGNAVYNKHDGVIMVVDNFYSAATGGQDIMSSRALNPARSTNNTIVDAVKGIGVKWVRHIDRTYDVTRMRDTLREALTSKEGGPKVIVASSECMLNKQRRVKPLFQKSVRDGQRMVRERFGVDEDVCTGDHACIRLSGCPSLSVKHTDDPLKDDPVAAIDNDCVGCGNCGEVSEAAVLCPSFYRADIIHNPNWFDRFVSGAAPRGDRLSATPSRKPPCRLRGLTRKLMNDLSRTPTRFATERPICVAIHAMGGQGGGVLSDWIVELAESQGWHAQSTSIPGVAQRTGATLYYVEMLPPKAGRAPILSLMPAQGEVDIVLAAELMEAGRSILRGLVTPDRSTLIASTHRLYSVAEKEKPGDATADPNAVMEAADVAAKRVIAFDMEVLANRNNSVISACLFGALAASGTLPFGRDSFEAIIKSGGKGVESNLNAFGAAHNQAMKPPSAARPVIAKPGKRFAPLPDSAGHPDLDKLLARIREFPAPLHDILFAGVKHLTDFQDPAYANEYLDRVSNIYELDRAHGGAAKAYALTAAAAKYVAVAMAYDDVIRVAELKTRSHRFERVRHENAVGTEQIVYTTEYMHPRLEEVAGTLPAPLGRWLEAHPRLFGWMLPQGPARALGNDRLVSDALRACRPQADPPQDAAPRPRNGASRTLAVACRRSCSGELRSRRRDHRRASPGQGLFRYACARRLEVRPRDRRRAAARRPRRRRRLAAPAARSRAAR